MEIVDNGEVLNEYVHTRDYVDILKEFDEVQFESPDEDGQVSAACLLSQSSVALKFVSLLRDLHRAAPTP